MLIASVMPPTRPFPLLITGRSLAARLSLLAAPDSYRVTPQHMTHTEAGQHHSHTYSHAFRSTSRFWPATPVTRRAHARPLPHHARPGSWQMRSSTARIALSMRAKEFLLQAGLRSHLQPPLHGPQTFRAAAGQAYSVRSAHSALAQETCKLLRCPALVVL